ncbi:hypothetical protein [Aeromonas cavernicola]|uniref:hypothetical protein n=1 Tax=Aeromonas cavernicola TaxID=1006623 RepID=UPI001F26DD61|nr:hypothetical protein [Aeromonas cavernicola]
MAAVAALQHQIGHHPPERWIAQPRVLAPDKGRVPVRLTESHQLAHQQGFPDGGNRRHQGLLNAWLAGEEHWQGEPLTLARLYPVWLDSCAFTAWLAPEFPALFAALRQSNLARPAHVRLRVHLCEPSFEWQGLTPTLWQQHNRGRDQAMADYLLTLPTQGVVLLAGARHLLKAAGDPHFTQPSAGQLLQTMRPGWLYVLHPWLHPQPLDEAGAEFESEQEQVCGLAGLTTADLYPDWPIHPPLDGLVDQLVRVAGAGREMRVCPCVLAEPWRRRLRERAPLLSAGIARQLQQWLG